MRKAALCSLLISGAIAALGCGGPVEFKKDDWLEYNAASQTDNGDVLLTGHKVVEVRYKGTNALYSRTITPFLALCWQMTPVHQLNCRHLKVAFGTKSKPEPPKAKPEPKPDDEKFLEWKPEDR